MRMPMSTTQNNVTNPPEIPPLSLATEKLSINCTAKIYRAEQKLTFLDYDYTNWFKNFLNWI